MSLSSMNSRPWPVSSPVSVPRRLRLDYAVVALDLDGTILPVDHRLPPLTAAVLRAVSRGGTEVIINTGRMFRSALPYARQLRLTGPISCYQGALVRVIGTGEILRHEPLPLEIALQILEQVETDGYAANVYQDDILYVEAMNEDIHRYLSVSKVEARAVGRLSEFLSGPTTKIVVGGEPAALDQLALRLRLLFPSHTIVKSHPAFLEITSPRISKASALALLGERYGFGPGDTIFFGDSYNDADALAWAAAADPLTGRAGLGISVANAPEEVKASGNGVCGSVEEQGVARFLLELAR